jgi:flagellar motor protein MotB
LRDCPDDWRVLEQAVTALAVAGRLCGFDPATAVSHQLRHDAHARFLSERTSELHRQIRALIGLSGDADLWAQLQAGKVIVSTCLTCIQPEVAVGMVGSFAPGSASVTDVMARALTSVAAILTRHPHNVHAVRGHADATESADALALSKARATAVVDALVAAGVKRTQLRSLALGDAVPIDKPDSAINRRVELQPL